MTFRGLLVLTATLSACSHQSRGPVEPTETAVGSYSQEWVLVTVNSAHIAATASDWDPHEQQTSSGSLPIGQLLGFLTPSLATVGAVLDTLDQPNTTTARDLPDPVVRVTHHEQVISRATESHVIEDSLRPSWQYAFYEYVPALREAGLDIAIIDADGTDRSDSIGLMNLSRAQLLEVAQAGRVANLDLAAGDLESTIIRVEPVTAARGPSMRHTLPLSQGLLQASDHVPQGAVITISVTGEGTVGSGGMFGCPVDVTTAGLSQCRKYNLRGFQELKKAPHGAPVALIGSKPTIRAVSLATDDGSCMQFTAPVSGPLVLGVNDRAPSNNSGAFEFEVTINSPASSPSRTCREVSTGTPSPEATSGPVAAAPGPEARPSSRF